MENGKEQDKTPKYRSLVLDDVRYRTLYTRKYEMRKPFEPSDPKKIRAFIPGIIRKVYVKAGSRVKAHDKLVILEAMKMKNHILAPFDGKIKQVYVKEGANVAKNEILVEFE